MNNRDIDLNFLNRDLEGLITSARNDFANSPFNPACQQRLKALLDLQGILQRQQLTQEQLKQVRYQVSSLAATKPPSPPNATTNGPVAPPQIPATPVQPVSQPLQNLLNPGTLAELIKATASRQHPTPPPQISSALPQMPIPQQSNTPQPAAPENLIALLRARGIIPGGSTTPSIMSSGSTPVPGTTLPFMMPNGMQPTPPALPTQGPPPSSGSAGVPMNTTSLKIDRPGLIVSLYDSRSNKCGTCGRRFFATEEGKEMKARHLDWHFKTNQRMTEASRRAQTRSWYVDERVCSSLLIDKL